MCLGHALQSALQVEAEQYERRHDYHKQIGHIDFRVGDHLRKAEIGVAPGQKFDKIVQNPACDNGEKAISAMLPIRLITPKAPPLAGLFKALVHIDGAGLRCAATANSMTITGRPSTKKAEDVEQHKAAAAVLAAHPWEFPDIAAADGAPGGQHDKAKAAAKAFAFLHSFLHFLFGSDLSTDDLCAALKVRNL